jgi:hypothetical protein
MWHDFLVSAAATGTRPYDLHCDGFFLSLSRLRAPQSSGRGPGPPSPWTSPARGRGHTFGVLRQRLSPFCGICTSPTTGSPGVSSSPWVYLHALAGYTDMAAALEGEPAARAVVNFTPVLFDQARRLRAAAQALAGYRHPAARSSAGRADPAAAAGAGTRRTGADLFARHPQFGGPIAMRRLGSSSRSCAARTQQAFPTGFVSTACLASPVLAWRNASRR